MELDENSIINYTQELPDSLNSSYNDFNCFNEFITNKNIITDNDSLYNNIDNDPRYFINSRDDKLNDESINKKLSFKTDTKTLKEKKDKNNFIVNSPNFKISINIEKLFSNESFVVNHHITKKRFLRENSHNASRSTLDVKQETNIFKINRSMPPTQYTYDKIKNEIFPKFKNKNIFDKIFITNPKILALEENMSDNIFLQKKRRNKNLSHTNEPKKKLGRKKNDDTLGKINSKHNKYSQDNIIKKIKSKLLHFLVEFLNNLLNSILKKNKINSYIKIVKNIEDNKIPKNVGLIKDLDYKNVIDRVKKEKNLEFFDMKLKDFLSSEISSKYKTLQKDSNKRIIEEILKEENENEIINFVFNLTFRQWLDSFLYKKEIKDYKNLDNEKINIINYHFKRVDDLLIEIYREFNTNYLSCYIFYLFNIERWYFIKMGRKSSKVKK